MSLAVLKRKSQVLYNNLSVGTKTPGVSLNSAHSGKTYVPQNVPSTHSLPGGFTLNGTRRSQGYIGQSSQSRHYVRTLAKGNVLKGHGGCCGSYHIVNVTPTELIDKLNDPTVVKKTVMNNQGMLDTKYLCCKPTVKPDSNQHISSSTLTFYKGQSTIECSDQTLSDSPAPRQNCITLPTRAFKSRFFNPISRPSSSCNITKNTFVNKNKRIAGLSSSQYTNAVSQSCPLEKPPAKACNSCPLPV